MGSDFVPVCPKKEEVNNSLKLGRLDMAYETKVKLGDAISLVENRLDLGYIWS